jgi:hypothetical protein
VKTKRLAAIIIFLTSFLTVFQRPSHDPVHEGRPLSEWLVDLSSMDPPIFHRAEEAVMALGTNCLPLLHQCLQDRDSSLRVNLLEIGEQLGIPCPPTAESLHSPALQACRVLGPAAGPLIPEISRFLEGCRQVEAVKVLVATGHATIPTVTPMLMNKNVDIRAGAATVLGTLAQQGETVVPALLPLLSDESPQVRVVASWALGRFGAQAQRALPQLALVAWDPVLEVRPQASSAQGRIHAAMAEREIQRDYP